LFCWKKLGENEVFTAISLTAMGLTRNPPQKRSAFQGMAGQARHDSGASLVTRHLSLLIKKKNQNEKKQIIIIYRPLIGQHERFGAVGL
jgi:hypothetical protein